jgi:DNA-binding MarR family transcriptional regulator
MLASLEKKGLVDRKSDPGDGRARLVCITQKGRRIYQQVHIETEGFRELLLSNLDEYERDSLLQSLHKVATAMTDNRPQPVMNGNLTNATQE